MPASGSTSHRRSGITLSRAFGLSRYVAVAAAALVAGAWLAFVPSPREAPYRFVAAWGEQGSGPGEFHDPIGIAVAGSEVYVSDSRNGRIQVFDLEGRFKRHFGTPGTGVGELGRPMNLAIHRGEIYVAEYFNDRVQVFALDGTPKRAIGRTGGGPGELNAPAGVAVAANGDVFVADFHNQRVQRLKADDGGFVRLWGTTGRIGVRAGEFNYPTDVALARDGTLYVADGYNDRIQAFGPDGAFRVKWGGPFAINIFGPFNGWFATVTGVAIDESGNVFVADFYNHRIQKFTADGVFLTSFGGQGQGPGEFNYAIAVASADDGTVFAVDYGNHRIQKWRPAR